MIPASDRTVTKSDNYFEAGEKPKKNALRPVNIELAIYAHDATDLIAKRFKIAARRVKTPRSGDEPLSIRRAATYFLRGKDYAVGAIAQIFGIDRGTVTEDIDFIQQLVAEDEAFDEQMEHLITGVDEMMLVKPGEFIDTCLAELEAKRAEEQALKSIRQARRVHEKAMVKKPDDPPEAVLRACESMSEETRKKVLERWASSTPRAA